MSDGETTGLLKGEPGTTVLVEQNRTGERELVEADDNGIYRDEQGRSYSAGAYSIIPEYEDESVATQISESTSELLASLVAAGAMEPDLKKYEAIVGTHHAMEVEKLLDSKEFYDDLMTYLKRENERSLAHHVEGFSGRADA